MGWQILHLKAIQDDGSALWPDYFPLEKLQALRRQMGSPIFTCMYLGNPQALSGQIFDVGWFRTATLSIAPRGKRPYPISTKEEEERVLWIHQEGRDAPLCRDDVLIYQFWDLAISEKETADYTCCCTLALNPTDMSVTILEFFREHLSFQKTQEAMATLALKWTPHAIGIESNAYQAAAVQQARNQLLFAITEVKSDRDKVTRARLPAALAESGKMWIVKGPWLEAFYDEAALFPEAPHDDTVDALSGACILAQKYVPSGFFLFG